MTCSSRYTSIVSQHHDASSCCKLLGGPDAFALVLGDEEQLDSHFPDRTYKGRGHVDHARLG